MSSNLIFQNPRYAEMATRIAPDYVSADPFPHAVIDDFLPTEMCDKLLTEFPDPSQIEWMKFDRHHSKKLATKGADQFGPYTAEVLAQFNSSALLGWLEQTTGIAGLIPDPHFEGGGLHQIQRGGFLKVHTDFNYHPRLKLDRRINAIVYLNKDWQEDYGGHLELWDRTMSRCVKKILPVYNRCVIFNTTDWSYHGHPEKLTCPEGRTRKSLALYYYSNGRPAEEKSDAHGTLWQERPAMRSVLRTLGSGVLHGMAKSLEAPAKGLRRMAVSIGATKAG